MINVLYLVERGSELEYNRKCIRHAFAHFFFPVGVGMILGINLKQFMLESSHHNSTNYGFVGEGALLRVLKTLKCTSFCFSKKQTDKLVHLALKNIAGRKISFCSRFGRFVWKLLLAFSLTFRGRTCHFHQVLRGVQSFAQICVRL